MDGERDLDAIELALLLEGLYRRYGYDFRNYAPAFLRRRVHKAMVEEKAGDLGALQHRLLRDPQCAGRLVRTLTVKVTSMFRHPPFFEELRRQLAALFEANPLVRIWHAGCCSGEEAYSVAILLAEEGLRHRCRIYATDVDDEALASAARGAFPLPAVKEFTGNYLRAGGRRDFSSYYTADEERAVFQPGLREGMVFARHNLATDASFNEFHLILCRNVMIYFDAVLRERVFRLLHESLAVGGALGLGEKESLRASPLQAHYAEVADGLRLYRRVR